MGRLSHLEITLPLMLQAFEDVLVVDWSCPDKSGKFAFDIGARVVFKNGEEYFNTSKARNFGAKFCESDYYVFIDADTWVTPYAADIINSKLCKGKQLINGRDVDGYDKEDLCGFLGVHREDFWAVGGYNENLKGRSTEDIHLRAELLFNGVEVERITSGLLGAIAHNNEMRQKHFKEDIYKSVRENHKTLLELFAKHGVTTDPYAHPLTGQIMCNSRNRLQ